METLLFNNLEIEKAVEILKNDGIVAFPTETVYGLGANGLKDSCVEKIFLAKERPQDNPLILHIASVEEVNPLVKEIPEKAKLLMGKFWPGALTIVLKKSSLVPDTVTCKLDSVALRMPNNEIALKLIEKCGFPLAAPSANISGKPSPTMASHVIEDLNGKIDAVIDGGATEIGIESTVIDLTSDIPTILRPGMISTDEIRKVIGEVNEFIFEETVLKPKSPGTKYIHYSPKAKVIFVDSQDYKNKINKITSENSFNSVILTTSKSFYAIQHFHLGTSPSDVAKNLFAYFRKLDSLGFNLIIVEPIPKTQEWEGIRNRLIKASNEIIK